MKDLDNEIKTDRISVLENILLTSEYEDEKLEGINQLKRKSDNRAIGQPIVIPPTVEPPDEGRVAQLIKEGYESQEIEAGFGDVGHNIMRRWIPKLFGVPHYTALRQLYLCQLVSEILETGIQDLTYGKIHSALPQFGRYEIIHLIDDQWGGILQAKIYFGRYIAIRLFRMGASDEYILRVLGYSGETITQSAKRERTFKKLFNGMTADEARAYFTSEYRETYGHFIWYSDLDNY